MNVLIIQISRLGDIVQSIPLINDLKAKYTDGSIHMLVNDVFSEASVLLPNVEVIPLVLERFVNTVSGEYVITENDYFLNIIESLNGKGFELIINLNNSPIAKEIFNKIDGDKKKGFGAEDKESKEWSAYITSFLKTRQLGSINLVDIFRMFGGVEHLSLRGTCDEANQNINSTKEQSVALQCGARNIKRQFTNQHYVDIATHYLSKGYKVYLLGTESESKTAIAIQHEVTSLNLINMTGKTDLKQLIEIISKCESVYTPDTGTMHLSALCNTPFVSLFYGPAYPFETLGYSLNATVYMPNKQYFPCYPCNDDDECLNSFACHRFSFQKVFEGTLNDEFCELSVGYDEIGQVLNPIDDAALLWREFTKHYFSFTVEQGVGERQISNDTKAMILRELKLWDMIDIDDFNTAVENFYFLKPLVFLTKMGYSELVNEAIRFMKEAICQKKT